MGNCYYKLNKIGYAILYYEKALKLLPHDPEIKFNLELANLKVIDRIEMPPRFFLFDWWDAVRHFYPINKLARLVITLYLFTTVFLIVLFFVKRDRFRRIVILLFSLSLILLLFWGSIFILNINEEKENILAVVVVPTVTVESAPEESSTDVFILHEGIKVRLKDQRGEWVKIELPDGKSGWMKSENVRVI